MRSGWLRDDLIPVAAAGSVLCGLTFLALTGAPTRLLLINMVAFGAGTALLAIARLASPVVERGRNLLLLGAASVLLATALFGISVEGASRWIVLGGLSLQPSLILVPTLLLGHVARPTRISAMAVVIAALAAALQPDRSIAAAILLVLLIDAAARRSRDAWLLVATSAAAFAMAIARPDTLPAVPHVDQILWTSLDTQPLAAAFVWGGTLLLFLPAAVLWRRGQGATAASFAALWGTLVVSALLANYPTPLVGYGASAILGYLLAALVLPGFLRAAAAQHSSGGPAAEDIRSLKMSAAALS